MNLPPKIEDTVFLAAMQSLVDEGLAEWIELNGEMALRQTEAGAAMALARADTKQ